MRSCFGSRRLACSSRRFRRGLLLGGIADAVVRGGNMGGGAVEDDVRASAHIEHHGALECIGVL